MPLFDEVAGDGLFLLEEDRRLARRDEAARPQIIITTMARPKSSMRYCAGIEIRMPKICLQVRHPSLAQHLGAADQHHRGERDADLRAHAAEHDDREDGRRFDEGEALRADEALAHREERAGEAAEEGAEREGGELGVAGVDAERTAGDLVLAQRLPGAPDRQAAQAQRHEIGERARGTGSGRRGRSCGGSASIRGRRNRRNRPARRRSGRPKKLIFGIEAMPA